HARPVFYRNGRKEPHVNMRGVAARMADRWPALWQRSVKHRLYELRRLANVARALTQHVMQTAIDEHVLQSAGAFHGTDQSPGACNVQVVYRRGRIPTGIIGVVIP